MMFPAFRSSLTHISAAFAFALILITVTALLFASCSRESYDMLRVVSPLPSGVIDRTQPFQFTFSRRAVSPDSLNQWTDTPFIEFDPPIPGKFMWHDTTVLVFVPDAPAKGDQKYSAKFNVQLLLQSSGAKTFSGDEKFTFSTERFRMVNAEFFYDRIGETKSIGIRANLTFTYDVNPQDITKYLTAKVDNAIQQHVTIVSPRAANVIAVEIGTIDETDKPKVISVLIDKGLVSPETGTPIVMDQPFSFTLPPVAELQIYGHSSGFDGAAGWIAINASQDIDTSVARSFIQIDPPHPYTLEAGGNNLTIRGGFGPGMQVHLVIKKGFESYLHGKTNADYEADVFFGNIKPSLKYDSPGGTYMLLSGQKQLSVKSMNVPKIKVSIAQIFRNNLLFFLGSSHGYYQYNGDDEDGEYGGYSYQGRRYSVGEYGRYIRFDTLRPKAATNKEQLSTIDLSNLLTQDHRGVYLVEVADAARSWETKSKLVSVSDLGIICKRSTNQIMVFVTSLATTSPAAGVTVKLISTNNQTIAQIVTDADGVARFDDFLKTTGDFNLSLITAEKGDDLNFIDLASNRVEDSRFDVGGKRDTKLQYDAMLYGDRNIYRPGEKLIIAGLVRQLHSPPPRALPVKLRITNPRGTMVGEMKLNLDDEGGFEASYQTVYSVLTGTYDVSLFTGNDIFLTSTEVSVEDFVPDRMRVELKASKPTANPGESIQYDVTALNFFGPPAAHRTVEFEGTFNHIPYFSKAFRDFNFSDDGAKDYQAEALVIKGETDANGKAKFTYPLPASLTSTGLLRARAKVAVFDETGRPVYQIAQTTVYPKPYLIGIKNLGDYYVKPNTDEVLKIIAVDPNDKPINGFRAKVELLRYEWHSVLRQAGENGNFRFVSERQAVSVWAKTVTLGSTPLEFKYSAPRSGDYVLRVSKEGDTGYNEASFYAYSWGGINDLSSFSIDPEARVQIIMNESSYTPGSRAHVLFQTPFSGRMLVTVERNGVYQYQYVDVAENSASLDIPVEEKYVPNVYISAILFRKIQGVDIPLLAGHGFAPMFVEKPTNKLNVSITAPPKIRPRTHQTITVSVNGGGGASLTLAAVDEGICQVKNFRTPDPFAYFYQRKALETETFDFFRFLLPEHQKASSSSGGSDEAVSKRVNPLGVKRFKPVALWSGIVKANRDGKAVIPFDIPDFNGELRLMAFVYKGDRFGSAEQAMKVSDPVVLSPALPRFASPDDSLIMPVTAFNTTDKTAKLQLQISVTGPMQAPMKTATLEIPPNQEKYVDIPLRATKDIGKATIKVSTTAFGEPLESVTELPVRPIASFTSTSVTGFVEEAKPVSVNVSKNYLPASRKSYLTLSPFPAANFAKELKYLIGYPYGCIEQTVSKAFPQIFLRDIALLLDPSILNHGSPAYFVNEAIAKVVSMQLPDGSFSYWQGEEYSAAWATAYATHFLLEAKKAGYAVPEGTLTRALARLVPIARSRHTYDYYSIGPGNKTTIIRIADKNILYSLYVLALAGQPEKGTMDFYRTEKALVTKDGQYLLSAAYNYAGDKRTALALMPQKYIPEENRRQMGEDFDSPIRANALILNMMLETDPDNPDIAVCLDYLSKAYKSYDWFSTQDDAFTLLAMGKMARAARKTTAQGTVTVGKQKLAYAGGDKRFDIDAFGSTVGIVLHGAGRVYYSMVTEGINTESTIKQEDRHLKVRREYFDRTGVAINPMTIKRNDLIIVRITLSADNPVNYVAVSDLLPAGLEIENPRLGEQSNYSFIKDPSTPSYTDIRDDRINFFFNRIDQDQEKLYYLVRAVSAGTFVQAPVTAEAMYDGLYYSASGQGKIRVLK